MTDYEKEAEVMVGFGYRYCVVDCTKYPIAWFLTKFDAEGFMGLQVVPENYKVLKTVV